MYWLQQFPQPFRKWSTPTVWWIPSGVCQHSNMWHRSLLPGQEDIHCHLQGRDYIPLLRREGLISPLSVPSYPKDRHTCPHPSTLLFCHHLYHSHQLLRHDQARHRVSTPSVLGPAGPTTPLTQPKLFFSLQQQFFKRGKSTWTREKTSCIKKEPTFNAEKGIFGS